MDFQIWLMMMMIACCSKLSQADHDHQISKRQIFSLAPSLPQSSYSFTTTCTPGATVGSIIANNVGGGAVTYSADPGTGTPYYVSINPTSGLITILTQATSSFSFNYRAANLYGAMVVPVNVVCSGSTIGTTGTFSQSSYFFTATTCTPGSTVGSIYNPGATFYTITNGNGQFTISNTGLITISSYLTSGTYSLTVTGSGYTGISSSVPVTITVSCNGIGTGTGFSQPSYTFYASTCTPGATIGSVYAIGASYYTILNSNNQFIISPTGLITMSTTVPSGTYSLQVTAASPNGGGASTALVTITVTCTVTGTTGIGTFSQPTYSFYASTCTPGAAVGTVVASGATFYTIVNSNNQFIISPTGLITLANTVPAGTYTLQISATSPYGVVGSTAIVTVTVTCNGITNGVAGTGPAFAQASYSLTQASCGSLSVGSVTASGASYYSVTSNSYNFWVNGTGAIFAAAGLAAGTYSLTVSATSASGTISSVPVTVVLTCATTNTG